VRTSTLVAALAFACVTLAVGYRAERHLNVPGVAPGDQWAMMDFRDAVYYPARALLDGNNPYDGPSYLRTYPVVNELAPYLPGGLVLGVPFLLVPYEEARVAYFLVTVALMVAMAALTLRVCGITTTAARCLALAAVLLASRPGQMIALLGQPTLFYVIGAYLALGFAVRRPWLAACGLAICASKPSFGLPMTACLLARDQRTVVARGLALTAAASIAVTAWIARAAVTQRGLLALAADSYASFTARPMNQASASLFRVDAAALAARLVPGGIGTREELLIGVAVLVVALVVLRRSRPSAHACSEPTPAAAAIACTATLLCVYHQAYDLLLIAWPAVALATGRWRVHPRWVCSVLLATFAFPFLNYLATETTVGAPGGTIGLGYLWWIAAASLNSLALAIAFAGSVALTRRRVAAFPPA